VDRQGFDPPRVGKWDQEDRLSPLTGIGYRSAVNRIGGGGDGGGGGGGGGVEKPLAVGSAEQSAVIDRYEGRSGWPVEVFDPRSLISACMRMETGCGDVNEVCRRRTTLRLSRRTGLEPRE
jgi:hypothetical protein